MTIGYLVFVYNTGSEQFLDISPKKVLYKTFESASIGAQRMATEQAYILGANIEELQLFNPQSYADRWGSVELFHITIGYKTICSIKVMAVNSDDE